MTPQTLEALTGPQLASMLHAWGYAPAAVTRQPSASEASEPLYKRTQRMYPFATAAGAWLCWEWWAPWEQIAQARELLWSVVAAQWTVMLEEGAVSVLPTLAAAEAGVGSSTAYYQPGDPQAEALAILRCVGYVACYTAEH